jgi:DNA-binding response OmpR family regulator
MTQPIHPTRILIVEDDDHARTSLTQVLERVRYQVDSVPDGETALERLNTPALQGQFAVVITDLLLFQVDGLAVLRAARATPEPPEVILLTGYGTLHTAIESLRLGVFDYLLKPCKPEELLHVVARAVQRFLERKQERTAMQFIAEGLAQLQPGKQVLQRPPEPPPARWQVGEIELNAGQHSATFRGEPLTLTPTEYALLADLVQANGAMRTYTELAKAAYGRTLEPQMAHQLLKTHIYNLRHKMAPTYILNVRSVGYRLIDPTLMHEQ